MLQQIMNTIKSQLIEWRILFYTILIVGIVFFLNKPIYFLCEKDGNWDEINKKAQKFIENVEKTIECKINISRASDPKSLIQLKSYLGSIEDFNSPQILDRMNRWMTD